MNGTRICEVVGCESKHDSRGYCAAHYNRWKRYGDPEGSPKRSESRSCEVEGCGRPHRSWGYCDMHGQRYYKHGDPVKVIGQSRKPCAVDGCESLSKGVGYCSKHLRRFRATGSPFTVRPGGRPLSGEHPGWDAVHFRLRSSRGKASAQMCTDCGNAASEWSYDNSDSNELFDEKKNVAYSLSLDHYAPRCVKCHRSFDAAYRKGQPASMRLTIKVLEANEREGK